MKYIKKPIAMEAVQFTGLNFVECRKFIGDNYDKTLNYPNVKTPGGTVAVVAGDWLIEGVSGEFYLCNQEMFKDLYEKVE